MNKYWVYFPEEAHDTGIGDFEQSSRLDSFDTIEQANKFIKAENREQKPTIVYGVLFITA